MTQTKLNLTTLERKVAESIAKHNYGEGCNTAEVAKELNLSINCVKGALGSLTKKAVITSQTETIFNLPNDIVVEYLFLAGMEGTYYWDELTEEEYAAQVDALLK